MNTTVALIYKKNIKYIFRSALRVLTLQVLFSIVSDAIYLQGISGTYYFPNDKKEFIDINESILCIQVLFLLYNKKVQLIGNRIII